jgi:hypothetical protein
VPGDAQVRGTPAGASTRCQRCHYALVGADGEGEPTLGILPDPGRAAQTRPSRRRLDDPPDPAPPPDPTAPVWKTDTSWRQFLRYPARRPAPPVGRHRRCYLQEVHDVRRQVGENLPDEVIGNATLVAGEVREEPFDVGRRRQGPRCEAEPCGLAVGMAVQPLDLRRTRAPASHPDLSASSTARPHPLGAPAPAPQAGLPEPPARLCGRCDATGSASSSTSPAIAADQPARSPAAPVGAASARKSRSWQERTPHLRWQAHPHPARSTHMHGAARAPLP